MPGASVGVRSSAGILLNLIADSGSRLLRSAVDSILASYHAPTIRTAIRVSLLLVRVCGTFCHRTCDETVAANYLSKN